MSRFEYLTAFVTLVLGLGVAELLLNLNRLIRARRRIKWHWLPFAWAAIALLLLINYWYSFYVNGQLPQWRTGVSFALFLLLPIMLFLISASVLPGEVPEAGVNLLAVYLENRSYLFTLLAIYYLAWAVIAPALGVIRWNDPYQIARIVPAVLFIALTRSTKLWLHAAVAVLTLILVCYRLSTQTIG